MVESVISVIFEMVSLLVNNTAGTVKGMFELFLRFLGSIGLVIGSGFGGFVLGILILGFVGFFLAKFVFSSGKTILILMAAGFLLLLFLIMGTA